MIRRDVIIPAGGTIDAAFAGRIGTSVRALAPFGPQGMPALQIVVDALRASGTIARIIVAADDAVRGRVTGVDAWIADTGNGSANILRGLAFLPDADAPALVCASDLPLIAPQDVAAFAAQCDTDSDLTVGLIGGDAYSAAYPDAPPSQFVLLRDAGPVTLSGLFGVRPSALLRNEARLAQAVAARKSQARMAGLLGPRLLWQWATRTLTLTGLTARAEALLHCRVQILQQDIAPALACDMDMADDYTYAHQIYASRLVS